MTRPMPRCVSIRPSALPAWTLAGVIWSPGMDGTGVNCTRCALFELCSDAVAGGDFAGCEGVLIDEIYSVPDTSAPVPDELDEIDDEDMPCLPEMMDWTWKAR